MILIVRTIRLNDHIYGVGLFGFSDFLFSGHISEGEIVSASEVVYYFIIFILLVLQYYYYYYN